MPEKKAQTDKVKTTSVEKPAVKKTVVKATTAVSKPKATTTKAKVTREAKPEVKAPVVKVTKLKTAEVKETPAVVAPKAAVIVERPAVKPEKKKIITGKVLNITLVKSGIGYSKRHKATLKALGFRHLHQTIQQVDSLSLRGMLAKVNHLVRIEEQVKK